MGVFPLAHWAKALVIRVSAIPWAIFAVLFAVSGAIRNRLYLPYWRSPAINGMLGPSSMIGGLGEIVWSSFQTLYHLVTLTASFDRAMVILMFSFSEFSFIIFMISGM